MSKRKQLKQLQIEALETAIGYTTAIDAMNDALAIRDWIEADLLEGEAHKIMGYMYDLSQRHYQLQGKR